jgi:PAS domain S-box-containing protein
MIATLEKIEILRKKALRLENLDLPEALVAAPGPAMDDLAELVAMVCNAPVAGVAIPAADRILLHARYGIRETELPLGSLPAAPSPRSQSVSEISDTTQHPAFARRGIVLGGRAFRFYADAPMTTPSGVRVGSLFVLDLPSRRLTPLQAQTLAVLARQAMASIELTRTVSQMETDARTRQSVESSIADERNFISTVLDTIDALVVVFDTAGRVVRYNRACQTAPGFDFPSLVGRALWDKLIPRSDIPAAMRNFDRLRAEGSGAAFEDQWLCRDGSLRRIAWSASPVFDGQGHINFIIATGIDVTVQRGAEETLRESESRYRQLVEGSLGMVCTHDLKGVLLSVNTHGAQSIGRVREDVVGHQLSEFIPEGRRAFFDRYLGNIVMKGEVQGLLHLRHDDGSLRYIAYRNKLIQTPGADPYVLAFGIDISEQVRAEDQLHSLTRQSNSILESVGDGIFGVDLGGNCTVVNPAASQMLGFKPEELLGRNMHALIHHTRADGTPYPPDECPIQNSLTDLDTVRVSNEVFWRKDGTSFPVEYVARPQIEVEPGPQPTVEPQVQSGILFETAPDIQPKVEPETDSASAAAKPAGKAVGVVVAFTDTTERRALDRMKDEFISTVSHELRTPLTSLRAALGLVTGGSLDSRPQKLRQMLDIAAGNTDRLVRLVNDILELERIGSGKAELHCTMCSADDLFRRAAVLQQSDALKAQIRITFNSHGVNVWADPDRILQTLTNLISNAIKFSPAGTEIHLRSRRGDANEAVIQVRDQGRGIPEDKLESIFERFHQVDASDSRTMGGTGLGLAICRSIVAQHGGRIWATSTLGKGSTFHFTLPTRPASNLL